MREKLKVFIKDKGKRALSVPQHVFGRCNMASIYSDSKWLKKLEKGYLLSKKIFHRYPLKYYLNDFIGMINDNCQNSEEKEKIKKNWIQIFKHSDDVEKLFMSNLFSLCGIFDDDICALLIDYALTTDNTENRYWIGMDISETTFLLQKGLYENYYVDRRRLLAKIAEDARCCLPEKKKSNRKKKVLAIVCYLLSDDIYNSSQRVAVMLAKGLSEYFEIYILPFDAFFVPRCDDTGLNTLSYFKTFSAFEKAEGIDNLFGNDATVVYVSNESHVKRYQNFIDNLYSVNPDIIMDISDEYSALSYYYYKDFPTVYMCMRVGASSSFFTHITGKKSTKEEINQRFHFMTDEGIIDWGGLPEYIPPDTDAYTRRQLGLDKSSFVVLTIGKCEKCCTDSFVDEIAALLEREKEIVWFIVGDKAPVYLHRKYPDLLSDRKVIERKFERNLKALCKECDCLLRPDISGGSGATAIAAMSGLPIAMTSFMCDPMRWLGRDFSSIDNYHDLALHIEHMYKDKDFYNREKKRVIALVTKATRAEEKWANLAGQLYNIIEEC